MAIVHQLLVLIHFFGFASLFSGLIGQKNITPKMINGSILSGALIQLLTGLILTGLNEPEVNHAKVGIKLLVLIIILVLAIKYRVITLPSYIYRLLLILTLLNTSLAVLWR